MKKTSNFFKLFILGMALVGMKAQAKPCDDLNQVNYFVQSAKIVVEHAVINFDGDSVAAGRDLDVAIQAIEDKAAATRCSLDLSNEAAGYFPDVKWSCPNIAGSLELVQKAIVRAAQTGLTNQHIISAGNLLQAEMPLCHLR